MNIKEFEDRVEKLKNSNRPFLTPALVAPVLGWNPQYIRIKAREDPSVFPFPVFTHGQRAEFPTVDVIMWCNSYLEKLKKLS